MANLFNQGSLNNYLEGLKNRLKDEIYRLIEDKDFSDSDNLRGRLIKNYIIECPTLKEEEKAIEESEIDVDVRGRLRL